MVERFSPKSWLSSKPRRSAGRDDRVQPAARGGSETRHVGGEAVGGAQTAARAVRRPRRRHAEAVALALDDEHRNGDGVEFVLARLRRAGGVVGLRGGQGG